jgi:predicted Rdx family selenoprotein
VPPVRMHVCGVTWCTQCKWCKRDALLVMFGLFHSLI